MLNIAMLGGISFQIDGITTHLELGRHGRMLACYLFEFADRAHRREWLADLFWGDLEPERSRSALNTAIWRIRKLLDLDPNVGHWRLVTNANEIKMQTTKSLSVDTHHLQEATRLVSRVGCERFTCDDEAIVTGAIEQYKGPFLDGENADWVLQERERLHCMFVRSTLALMRLTTQRGDIENALEYGRRILVVDVLRESVQRDVMLLLVLNGQRAEAIHAYQRLRAVLKRDLGIEPMPETKRLGEAIHSGTVFGQLEDYVKTQFTSPSMLVAKSH